MLPPLWFPQDVKVEGVGGRGGGNTIAISFPVPVYSIGHSRVVGEVMWSMCLMGEDLQMRWEREE